MPILKTIELNGTEYNISPEGISPENIVMSVVPSAWESQELSIEDGKYVVNYYEISNNANMSVITADIPSGAKVIEFTSFDAPTSAHTKAQFLLDSGEVVVVTPTIYTKIENLLYVDKCDIPDGAVSIRTTIYTSKKTDAFVKTQGYETYTPLWLDLPEKTVDASSIKGEVDYTRTPLTVSYEDGYTTGYTGSFANPGYTQKASSSSMSIATISGIEQLKLYEIDSYYDVSASPGGIVVWFDADGKRLTYENGLPYNYVLSSVQIRAITIGNHYRQIVMSPLGAASAQIAVKTAAKTACQFNAISYTQKSAEWLSVGIRNIDSQCLDIIKQDALDSVYGKKYDYHTIIDKSKTVANKTAVLFGDSIAAGVSSGTTDSNFKMWANIVKTRLNITLTNSAVSAKNITNNDSDSNSISAKVIAYTGDAATIIIAGGTNDHSNTKPLGVWGDTTVVTFYGALRAMCEHLKTLSAEKVVFITPINKTSKYTNPNTLDKYREAIQITARYYGFDVIEGKDFGFPENEGIAQQLFVYDGLHPTQAGHVMYANNICEWF